MSVVDDVEQASGRVSADRARVTLSGLFGWAIDRGYLDTNPTMNVRARAQGGARERVLSEAELVEVWKACEDAGEFGAIVRLLMLTGQRRAEIGDLAWSEIDLDKRQIELPERRTKNGRPHIVPLSDEALAILQDVPRGEGRDLVFGRGAGGFGGWSRPRRIWTLRIAKAQGAGRPQGARQTDAGLDAARSAPLIRHARQRAGNCAAARGGSDREPHQRRQGWRCRRLQSRQLPHREAAGARVVGGTCDGTGGGAGGQDRASEAPTAGQRWFVRRRPLSARLRNVRVTRQACLSECILIVVHPLRALLPARQPPPARYQSERNCAALGWASS